MHSHCVESADYMSATKTPPLKGIKVIELGTLIAAPFCSRILAEFGAEVIKIESPDGGDQLRQWRKMYEGTSRKLVQDADIVIENFRPGALEKWNIGWEQLSAINPRLIMVRLSGYGQTGPDRDKPGFGVIGESMGGLRYVTGYADRPPVRLGVSIGDSIAALYGVIGAMMALQHRHASGRGQMVDVALYEAVFSMMESLVPEFDVLGFVRERAGNALPGIVPSNTYPTQDGKFVIIGANNDAIFKRLMNAMGRSDLADDAQLATNAGRVPRTAEIDAAIGAWTAAHDLEVVLKALDGVDVPAAKVYDVADIVSDAQYLARDMIEQHQLPDGKPVKLPGIVPKLSDTPGATEWIGPKLGEHTEEILRGLGYDTAAQQALKARGVT